MFNVIYFIVRDFSNNQDWWRLFGGWGLMMMLRASLLPVIRLGGFFLYVCDISTYLSTSSCKIDNNYWDHTILVWHYHQLLIWASLFWMLVLFCHSYVSCSCAKWCFFVAVIPITDSTPFIVAIPSIHFPRHRICACPHKMDWQLHIAMRSAKMIMKVAAVWVVFLAWATIINLDRLDQAGFLDPLILFYQQVWFYRHRGNVSYATCNLLCCYISICI